VLLSYKRAPIFVAPDLGTSRECRVDGGKQPIRCDCPRTETRTTADTTFPEGAIPPLLKFGGDDPLSHQVAFARLRGWLVSGSPSLTCTTPCICLHSFVRPGCTDWSVRGPDGVLGLRIFSHSINFAPHSPVPRNLENSQFHGDLIAGQDRQLFS
jgi:hypothetical protein